MPETHALITGGGATGPGSCASPGKKQQIPTTGRGGKREILVLRWEERHVPWRGFYSKEGKKPRKGRHCSFMGGKFSLRGGQIISSFVSPEGGSLALGTGKKEKEGHGR